MFLAIVLNLRRAPVLLSFFVGFDWIDPNSFLSLFRSPLMTAKYAIITL